MPMILNLPKVLTFSAFLMKLTDKKVEKYTKYILPAEGAGARKARNGSSKMYHKDIFFFFNFLRFN